MNRPLLALLFAACASTASALTVTLQVQNETCTYANGSVYAGVSGGVPPYTYLWGGGETTEGLTGLSAGTYTVTVTDFEGTQVSNQATIISQNYPDFTAWTHSYCPGDIYHIPFEPQPPPNLWGDYSPYMLSQGELFPVPLAQPGNYYIDMGPLAPGTPFSINYADVNGCPGLITGVAGDLATNWATVGVLSVEGSCTGMNNGSILFNTFGIGPFDSFPILRRPGDGTFEFINTTEWVNGCECSRFPNLAPGDYWLMVSLALTPMLVQNGFTCASDSVLVTVPDLGTTCGVITGTTYMDYNSDCIDTEANAAGVVVELQPGPFYTTSGGQYSVTVPNGSYTLSTSAPAITQSCPAGATVNANVVTANIGHQPTVPLDLGIGLASGPARPGFQLEYLMTVQNLSSAASGATTTTLQFDPLLGFISATPAPMSVVGNTITWSQGSLDVFQQRDYVINMQVPPDVGLLGTVLLASAAVSCANTDGDLSNNDASTAVTVTGSFDPNDKAAFTSTRASDALYFIDEDEWIDYVIRFQNTGTDLAFNIIVTDTLPPTLDPASISLVSASHAHTWSVAGQGVLKFIFSNILLPDSNANEPGSHGLISFRIKPRLPVLPGTVIENTANIFFDFNPPVITEPSVLVAEFSTGVGTNPVGRLSITPNPALDHVLIRSEGAVMRAVNIITTDGRVVNNSSPQSTSTEIAVANLRAGTYLAEVVLTDGTTIRQPFIKR